MDGIGSTTTTTTATTSAGAAMQGLGKDDFLKLLVAQLRYQNPMNPMDQKDFMGQMAQFTTVEQLTNMSASFERLNTASHVAQAVSLIGRSVTYETPEGATATGVAGSVSLVDGQILVAVGDASVLPSAIRGVA